MIPSSSRSFFFQTLSSSAAAAPGIVYLVPPCRVAKCPNARSISRGEVEHEQYVYEALGSHPRILRFLGPLEGGDGSSIVRGPRARYATARSDARAARAPAVEEWENRERRWARQLIQGLVYIHSRDVMHGDVSAANVLVTDEDELVFCDFAGSVLRGKTRLCRRLRAAVFPAGKGRDCAAESAG